MMASPSTCFGGRKLRARGVARHVGRRTRDTGRRRVGAVFGNEVIAPGNRADGNRVECGQDIQFASMGALFVEPFLNAVRYDIELVRWPCVIRGWPLSASLSPSIPLFMPRMKPRLTTQYATGPPLHPHLIRSIQYRNRIKKVSTKRAITRLSLPILRDSLTRDSCGDHKKF